MRHTPTQNFGEFSKGIQRYLMRSIFFIYGLTPQCRIFSPIENGSNAEYDKFSSDLHCSCQDSIYGKRSDTCQSKSDRRAIENLQRKETSRTEHNVSLDHHQESRK